MDGVTLMQKSVDFQFQLRGRESYKKNLAEKGKEKTEERHVVQRLEQSADDKRIGIRSDVVVVVGCQAHRRIRLLQDDRDRVPVRRRREPLEPGDSGSEEPRLHDEAHGEVGALRPDRARRLRLPRLPHRPPGRLLRHRKRRFRARQFRLPVGVQALRSRRRQHVHAVQYVADGGRGPAVSKLYLLKA